MAKKAGIYWRGTQTGTDPEDRAPSTSCKTGQGTRGHIESFGASAVTERYKRAGVTADTDVTDFFDLPPSVAGAGTMWRTAWNKAKTAIDELRDAEDASSYDWTGAIGDSDETVATLAYRADTGASAERFETTSHIGLLSRRKSYVGLSPESWNTVIDKMIANPSLQQTVVNIGFRGAPSPGSTYNCQLTRSIVSATGKPSTDLPILDDVVYQVITDAGNNDWSRDWYLEFWAASDATWDGNYALLGSVSKDYVMDFSGTRDLYQNVTDYYYLDGSVNYFMIKLAHDTTTEGGSGDISRPAAPTGVQEEGLDDGGVRGFFGYLGTVTDDV